MNEISAPHKIVLHSAYQKFKKSEKIVITKTKKTKKTVVQIQNCNYQNEMILQKLELHTVE